VFPLPEDHLEKARRSGMGYPPRLLLPRLPRKKEISDGRKEAAGSSSVRTGRAPNVRKQGRMMKRRAVRNAARCRAKGSAAYSKMPERRAATDEEDASFAELLGEIPKVDLLSRVIQTDEFISIPEGEEL
jgi:hypothetical protein